MNDPFLRQLQAALQSYSFVHAQTQLDQSLLHVRMPGIDGFETCRRMVTYFLNAPAK